MNQNNDQVDDKSNNDKPEAELESSFRSSYRQTYTNLKMYWGGDEQLTENSSSDGWAAASSAATSPNALNAALSATSSSNRVVPDGTSSQSTQPKGASNAASDSVGGLAAAGSSRADRAGGLVEKPLPPAGAHAPHHPWHLGSGSKRKPAGLKQKLPNDEPVPMFGDELKSGVTAEPTGSGTPAAPISPAPTGTSPAPTATSPAPTGTSPAPTGTSPDAAAPTASGSNQAPSPSPDPKPHFGAPSAINNGMPPPPAEGEVRHLGGRGIPYSVDGANGQPNLDVLKKIAASPSASQSQQPWTPHQLPQPAASTAPEAGISGASSDASGLLSDAPDASAAPHFGEIPESVNAPHFGAPLPPPHPVPAPGPQILTPGAPPLPVPPVEEPLLGDHEDLEQGTDLYAPTIEVITPPVPKEELKDEPFDESVAHLYLPTADVSKPVIAQNDMLNPVQPQPQPQPKPQPPAQSELASGSGQNTGPSLPNLPKHSNSTSDPLTFHRPTNLPTPSAVPSEDSLKSENWDNSARAKKPRLNSYIDRQIGKDGGEPTEDTDSEDDEQDFRRRKPAPNKNVIAVAAVVLVVAVGGFFAVQMIGKGGLSGSNDSWKPIAASADKSIEEGKFGEAIAALDEAIKKNPNVAELFHKRGLAKLQSHDRASYDSALQDLNVAINKDAKLLEAVLDRAAIRIELGQFEDAINDYDQLIKQGKDTDKVHYGRGLAKYYSGDYAAAESEFEKILEHDSENLAAKIALGTTLYKKSDTAGADNKYADASRSDTTGLALRNRAILAYEQGPAGFNAAHKFYSDAIAANPKDANLYNERGILHWMQKDALAATSDFKAAVERDPKLESAKNNLSHVSKTTGNGGNDAVLKLLDGDWKGAATAADKIIGEVGIDSAEGVRATLLKWVATNYKNQTVLAGEILRTAEKPAAKNPWQSTLVKYLVNEIDFDTAFKAASTQAEKTDLNYYGAIKNLFDTKQPEEARKKLKWVTDKGLTTSPEYALAKKSLEWLNDENSTEGDSQ